MRPAVDSGINDYADARTGCPHSAHMRRREAPPERGSGTLMPRAFCLFSLTVACLRRRLHQSSPRAGRCRSLRLRRAWAPLQISRVGAAAADDDVDPEGTEAAASVGLAEDPLALDLDDLASAQPPVERAEAAEVPVASPRAATGALAPPGMASPRQPRLVDDDE